MKKSIAEILDFKIESEKIISSGRIILFENGILFFELDEQQYTTPIPELQHQIDCFLEMRKGIPGPFLSDNRRMRFVRREEKQFISANFPKFATKAAVIVNNDATKLLLELFLKMNKHPIPIKGYQNPHKAVDWLLK